MKRNVFDNYLHPFIYSKGLHQDRVLKIYITWGKSGLVVMP